MGHPPRWPHQHSTTPSLPSLLTRSSIKSQKGTHMIWGRASQEMLPPRKWPAVFWREENVTSGATSEAENRYSSLLTSTIIVTSLKIQFSFLGIHVAFWKAQWFHKWIFCFPLKSWNSSWFLKNELRVPTSPVAQLTTDHSESIWGLVTLECIRQHWDLSKLIRMGWIADDKVPSIIHSAHATHATHPSHASSCLIFWWEVSNYTLCRCHQRWHADTHNSSHTNVRFHCKFLHP